MHILLLKKKKKKTGNSFQYFSWFKIREFQYLTLKKFLKFYENQCS